MIVFIGHLATACHESIIINIPKMVLVLHKHLPLYSVMYSCFFFLLCENQKTASSVKIEQSSCIDVHHRNEHEEETNDIKILI